MCTHRRRSTAHTCLVFLAVVCEILLWPEAGATSNVHGVRLFLFQRDEVDTLSDWLFYHASIFGPTNIIVMDNKSSQKLVLDTLKYWAELGVTVVSHDGSFRAKHKSLTNAMNTRIQDDQGAKFLVPMDADEFIIRLTDNNKFSVGTQDILQGFDNLPTDGTRYKFRPVHAGFCGDMFNTTGRRAVDARHFIVYQQDCATKTFFLRQSFVSTDQGNHWGSTTADANCSVDLTTLKPPSEGPPCPLKANCFHRTDIGLVHYGNSAALKDFKAYKDKMLRGYRAYHGNDTSPDCTIPGGRHYCKFYVQLNTGGDTVVQQTYKRHYQLPGRDPQSSYNAIIALTLLQKRQITP
jgi:hypothetical protein